MQIAIEPYNERWPEIFQAEKDVIAKALQHLAPFIEHFGSTSIVGLPAKPIIDILVGLNRQEELDQTIKAMVGVGYTYIKKYEAQWPTRRFFMHLASFQRTPPSLIDVNDNTVIG